MHLPPPPPPPPPKGKGGESVFATVKAALFFLALLWIQFILRKMGKKGRICPRGKKGKFFSKSLLKNQLSQFTVKAKRELVC